jgi:hypothetical protein
MPVERSTMLGAQLWVVRWSPREGVTAADVEAALDAHLEWMLGLEAAGHVVAKGLRTFDVLGWRVMEGALTVRVSFGTATYRIR